MKDSALYIFSFFLAADSKMPQVFDRWDSELDKAWVLPGTVGYFQPPEPGSDGVWRCTVKAYSIENARLKFAEATRGMQIQTVDESSIPLGKQTLWGFFKTPRTNDKRRKLTKTIAPSASRHLSNQRLRRFIKREAQRHAKLDFHLQSDLMQEAYMRVCGVETDDLEILKREATRAIHAAAMREWSQRAKGYSDSSIDSKRFEPGRQVEVRDHQTKIRKKST